MVWTADEDMVSFLYYTVSKQLTANIFIPGDPLLPTALDSNSLCSALQLLFFATLLIASLNTYGLSFWKIKQFFSHGPSKSN